VLDEVSGILAAARLANAGALDGAALAGCRRRVTDRLDVLTGLPRADRWIEVRAGVLPTVLRRAAEVGDVVVDCGFGVEEDTDPLRGAGRDGMARDVLREADEVVVVGSAEPTGLARLARALVQLAEVSPGTPVRVVVNRMRDTLGWSRRDITGMVEGYVRPLGVHFLPEDRPAVDRALVAGRSLLETGDSPLTRALAEVAAAAYDAPAQAPKSR
jgi:MinD-like ATPase involved in chromosome partitioning or flagellar assembly